jgi:hypothetical protein
MRVLKPEGESTLKGSKDSMAKKRIIDSRIRRSQDFVSLTYRQRDLWHGLITVADDQGRLLGILASVRSEVFPLDDVTLEDVEGDLQALIDQLMIVIYQVENKPIIQIVNWWKYQQKQWAGPSDYPATDGWVDRLRYHGSEHKVIQDGWEQPGGFSGDWWLCEPGGKQGNKPGRKPGENQVENQAGLNDNDSDRGSNDEEEDPELTVPVNLEGWHLQIQDSKNKPAALREMVETLYPTQAEYPDYGYLGKVARQVGGYGRLASLLWEFAAKKPAGDVLAYIQEVFKKRKAENEPAGFDGLRDFAEEQGFGDGK